MPANLYLSDFGDAAFERLRQVIQAKQERDPLAPVTVVVPSNYAGLAIRRRLARTAPVVNVRFLVLSRVAELLGAPALAAAGRRPLAKWIRSEAIRVAIAAHVDADPASIFRDVEDHLATEESLGATFRDLRDAPDATLRRLEAGGSRAMEIVSLYRRFRSLTEAEYYDESDLARAAADAVETGGAALRDIGHVVVFLPRRLSPSEAEFVNALAGTGRASVILGMTGDEDADRSSKAIQSRLATGVQPGLFAAHTTPTATRIVSVTDAQEEVRTVARLVMERLRAGTPLHRMAIVYPVRETYAPALHELLSAAEIPHNGPAVATLGESLSGRFLLRMLRLPDTNFRRDAVMDWLASGPVLEHEGRNNRVPTGWWDGISREAGIVAGPGEWSQRLAVYRRTLQARKVDEERPLSEGQVRRIDRTLPQTDLLERFVGELVGRLENSGRSTWREQAEWAKELLLRYLGPRPDFSGCPEEQRRSEEEAYDQILETIENLVALDAVRLSAGVARGVSAATFTRALEQLLEAPGRRGEKFGTGVFCGSFRDLAGMDFETVFVLGMVEGQAPVIGQEDPLLPDGERAQADPELPQLSSRRGDEARDYYATLASARERVLLVPAANLGGQQKYQPSRWVLHAAMHLSGSGQPMGVDDFNRLPSTTWLERVASFQQGIIGRMEPAMLQEYDLRMLQPARWPERHALARLAPSFARGIAATRARRGKPLSEFDGLIGRDANRRPRRTSPTALQTWATCPFLYFLRHVLGVSEREEPETVLVLSAAERGTLIHEVLDAFMKANDGWHEPWNDAKRDELLAVAEAAFTQKEAQGLTGKPLLWHLERDRIRRDLEGFLKADSDRSQETGFYFLRGEHSFGDPGGGAAEVSVPLDNGTSIAFRGRIDRVDRDLSGRLAVYDYKTGSTSTYKEMDNDPTKAGQLLQLPVYALAAREAFGTADSDIDAFYWFVTRKGEYELKPAGENADQMPRFRRQLQLIADGIESGLFPANPGAATWRPGKSSYENCVYCPYDRLCQQDRHRAWGRKQEDERLAGYLKLAETGDVVSDE